jgi:hypothetical protein
LRGGKDAVGIGGGHLLVLFGREDAGDEFAFVGLAGDDDVVDPLALAGVEPELGFAFRGVLHGMRLRTNYLTSLEISLIA